MKKRFLLLTLIMCLLGGVKSSLLNAQDDPNVVTIGEGTKTNYNIPFDIYYEYSFCQQLFTSKEINKTGTITSISLRFYGETNSVGNMNGATIEPNNKTFTRNIAIYLTNVEATCLTAGINLEEDAEPDFSGEVTLNPKSWVVFDISNGFTLEEGKNLLVTIADNTGNKAGSKYYYWYCDAVDDGFALSKSNSQLTDPSQVDNKNPNVQNNRSQIQLTFASDGGGEDDPETPAFEFTTEGNWNEGDNWKGGAVPGNGAIVVLKANATITAEDNINVADLTISEGASLTINGSLNITGKFSNTDASKLVINDGGQIFQKNAGVKATFNMSINNPTEWSENNIDGWQFISSPFTDASISDFVTTGDGNDYDLYKFDGKQVGAEWQNQKAIATFDTQFVPGRGYLASYESKKDVSVSGTLRNELTMNYTFGDYQYNVDLKDFHLVGNPFPFDMDMSKLYNMTYNIIEGYAVVNNGSYSYYNLEGTIPAGDGFFVKATGRDATFYYNHNAKSSRSGNVNSLNIIATGNAGNDNVVVNFNGEGEGFPKLQNFNDDIATVYVQNNDANYGIYNCDENTTEIELCFNANQMGNYTISAQAEGKFETLTLVDRFTGIETNLLVEDYRFTAMSEENNNRFFIRLGNGQQTTDNSHFAYVSGEDLIIEAEGTVQIIDMMGRVVYSSDAACHVNRINVSEFNNAAYVVRVINENEVKVEKIIL